MSSRGNRCPEGNVDATARQARWQRRDARLNASRLIKALRATASVAKLGR